jgi:hypothetical protein
MGRPRMSAAEITGLLVGLLGGISGGSAQVQIGSVPLATVDAGSKNLDVQIGSLLNEPRKRRSVVLKEGPVGLWKGRSIPSELARKGWRLTVHDGPDELMALGRGTSALTGHVHVTPAALWKLRKLI